MLNIQRACKYKFKDSEINICEYHDLEISLGAGLKSLELLFHIGNILWIHGRNVGHTYLSLHHSETLYKCLWRKNPWPKLSGHKGLLLMNDPIKRLQFLILAKRTEFMIPWISHNPWALRWTTGFFLLFPGYFLLFPGYFLPQFLSFMNKMMKKCPWTPDALFLDFLSPSVNPWSFLIPFMIPDAFESPLWSLTLLNPLYDPWCFWIPFMIPEGLLIRFAPWGLLYPLEVCSWIGMIPEDCYTSCRSYSCMNDDIAWASMPSFSFLHCSSYRRIHWIMIYSWQVHLCDQHPWTLSFSKTISWMWSHDQLSIVWFGVWKKFETQFSISPLETFSIISSYHTWSTNPEPPFHPLAQACHSAMQSQGIGLHLLTVSKLPQPFNLVPLDFSWEQRPPFTRDLESLGTPGIANHTSKISFLVPSTAFITKSHSREKFQGCGLTSHLPGPRAKGHDGNQ